MSDWIVEFTVCGTMLLTALCVASWWIRTSSAAMRHAVWVTGLVGLLALAFMLALLPRLNVVPDPYSQWAANNPAVPAAASDGTVVTPTNIDGIKFAPIAAEAHSIAKDSPESTSVPPPAIYPMAPAGSRDLLAVVATLWLAGCLLAVARLLLARIWLFHTARNSERCDDAAVLAEVLSCAAQLGYPRRLRLYISNDETMPMCWGIVCPSLRLPRAIIDGPAEQLRAALLHELGHLARRDPVWQLLVQISGSLFWFHPLLWYALQQCDATRESACDDLVLNAGVAPDRYAHCLLKVVSTGSLPRFASGVGIAMSRTSQMEDRIRMVMSRTSDRQPLGRRRTIGLALAISTCLLPLAVIRGQEPTTVASEIDDTTVKSASSNERPVAASPNDELHVSGRVLAPDGTPISGALVMSEAWIDKAGRTFVSHRTDENGEYTLTYRKPDRYFPSFTTWVHAEGYALQGLHIQGMIRGATGLKKLDIHLKQTEPITYRVHNPDGTPAVGAMIIPNAFRLPLGKTVSTTNAYQRYFLHNFLPASLAKTIGRRCDENGQVTLTGIAAGTFSVIDVSSKQFGTQRIKVKEGETELWLVKTGEIRGKVEMDSPDLVAGTTVRLITKHAGNDRGLAEVKLDPHGRFHVPAIAAGGIQSVHIDWDPNLPIHPYLDQRTDRSVVADQTLNLVIETR